VQVGKKLAYGGELSCGDRDEGGRKWRTPLFWGGSSDVQGKDPGSRGKRRKKGIPSGEMGRKRTPSFRYGGLEVLD